MAERVLHGVGILVGLLGVLALAGCGTTGNSLTGSSGTGADAGPWPQAPMRAKTATATTPSPDDPPMAPLRVLLRAKSPKDELELRLTPLQVDVKFKEQWVPVTTGADIAKIEALPLRFDAKGAVSLLAKTQVPKRKYTQVRLRLDEKKSLLATTTQKWMLNAPTPVVLDLGEWTPDEKSQNMLCFTIDGSKITTSDTTATLPADAVTLAKGVPAGGISGKLSPTLPTAHVDIYWGKTKVLFASVNPAADGAFTVDQLPPGSYRLEMTTPGFHQIEPRKDLVHVEDKVIALHDTELTPDTPK